jgi:eukaryotic-like serine/threonine-protein kinase
MSVEIGQNISHYEILEKLGEGGMGIIYKAQDLKLKRIVALKFLPSELTRAPEAKARFIREAQAASALQHHNICTIHDIDETADGQLFIVMDCYEGQTLRDKIKANRLKTEEALEIAVQIAEGLNKAHEKEIIHRDIKPANILITNDGVVKILDFGLAKLSGQTIITKEHSTLGTVNYMSPEQVRGENVDQRSDIWSLGLLFYEMVSGHCAFTGDYDQSIMYAIVNEQPEPLSVIVADLPKNLESIIDKTLAKDPNQRYQNTHNLLADLYKIKNHSGDNNISAAAQSKRPFFRKKTFILNTIIALLAVTILIAGTYFLIPSAFKKTLPERKKLVVLPFENLGKEQDDYFAAGITDEITCRIAAIQGLGVISRTSALQYAKSDKSTSQIAAELGVDYILEGTIRWDRSQDRPDRVRITPQLIRASDDTHLWSDIYDREIKDIFGIQSDIAHSVVTNLGIVLDKTGQETIGFHYTKNLDAYHAFLQGRYYTTRSHFTLSIWQHGIESFTEATQIDSNFALAYAELAKAHARLWYLRQDLSEHRLSLAKEAAERALSLAPDQPDVHLALGYYYLWAYRDKKKAWEHLAIAEKGMSNNVDILKAKAAILEPQGDWQELQNTLERALELSPRDVSIMTDLEFIYWITRKYQKAEEIGNKAIVLGPNEVWPYIYKVFINFSWKGANATSRNALMAIPKEHEWYIYTLFWQDIGEHNYARALDDLKSYGEEWITNKLWAAPCIMYKAYVYDFLGQAQLAIACYDSARIQLEEAVRLYPNDPRYHSSLGIAYAALGFKEQAIREGNRAVELLPLSKDAAYGIAYAQDLAIIYARVGEFEAAINQIEILLKNPSWLSPTWFEVDQRFAPLSDNPAFQQLLRKYFGFPI